MYGILGVFEALGLDDDVYYRHPVSDLRDLFAGDGDVFKSRVAPYMEEALERSVNCVPLILEDGDVSRAAVASVLPDLVGVLPSTLKINTKEALGKKDHGRCRISQPECAVTKSQKALLRRILEQEYVLYNRAVEYAKHLASCGRKVR
jgi:hypothetical protein